MNSKETKLLDRITIRSFINEKDYFNNESKMSQI